MDIYQISVRESSGDPAVGWQVSVAKQYVLKGAKSSVALGESEFYATKEQAWESIQKRVEKLDFNRHARPVARLCHEPVHAKDGVSRNL